ncbi:MAG: hypothetical protein Q9176_004379 [Flavoplaca citrina]
MDRTDSAGGLRSDMPRRLQAKGKFRKSIIEFTYDGSYAAIIAGNPWFVRKKMVSNSSRDLEDLE